MKISDKLYNPIVGGLILALGLSSFGIGLWVGLDSAKAKVDMLEAKDAERTKIMSRVFITVTTLEQKLEEVNDVLKLTITEKEKALLHNTGLED